MVYVLAGLAILMFVVTVLAAVSGRLRLSSCCATADPANDLRMRDAFAEQQDDGASQR